MKLAKSVTEAVNVLKKAGFEIATGEGKIEVRKEGLINPADIRTQAAQALSEAGFQAYYLKEVYAFMGSKKPFRTEDEGFVEFEPWAEVFTKVLEQKKVAQLNKAQVEETR